MSAFRRKFGPRRAALAAVGVFAFFGTAAAGRPAAAAAPTYPDILPLSKVKPGMTGYGLTTFKGTTISRFEVTIIGIMRKANNGHDLILIRMKGGPITERGANLIHGMSGSPIYINDKCIGAFSMGEPWPKEPVGMVTPIEDMLEAWDPNIPQTPPYFQPAEKQPTNPSPTDKSGPDTRQDGKKRQEPGKTTYNNPLFPTPNTQHPTPEYLTPWKPDNAERVVHLAQPIQVGSRRITQVVLNARPGTKRTSGANVAVMQRATSYAVVGGVGERERAWFQKELDKRGYAVTLMQAPAVSGKSGLPATTLHPGSVFGTFLATGDVQFGGYGTVTYRKGNRLLGFGHPLMGLGALDAAITSASVLDVFSSLQSSHLDAETGPVVGTLTQDRNFSVGADLSRKPLQIPFDVTVRDETTHRSQTFHSLLFRHPDLTAALMSLVGRSAVSNVHNMPGDVMAKVTTTVEAGEVGKITRSNLMFDADDISQPAIQDLTDITNIISGNPFYPLPIKRASMTVDLYSGHNTATIERIFLKQGKYEPGDTLDVGVALKPYRRESIIKTLSLKIPSDTPSGRYVLLVRGGMASMMRFGSFLGGGGAPDPQTPPVNVRQMLARLHTRETNTDMVARLILNTAAPAIEGEKLSQLPPHIAVLMRSDRNSGVRIERDELRVTGSTDYVVSGTQQLVVTVQRKNTQEVTGPPAFPGASGGISPGGSPSLQPGSGALSSAPPIQDDSERDSQDTPQASLPLNATTQFWQSALNGPQPDLGDFQTPDPATPLKPPVEEPTPKAGKNAKAKNGKSKVLTPAPPADAVVSVPITTTTDTKPATTLNDSEPVKIVARQMQVWRQTGASGFSAGKFTGTSVTATGELRLAPRLRRLATTNETYIWSLAVDGQGGLYAGTGTSGKILKVDLTGKVTTFAQLPIVSVQSLLAAKDGTLWAGSSVKGQLYHVKQDGTSTLIATLPENYILALCQDSQGNIFAGTGNGGSVYKIAPDYAPTDATRTDALKPFVKTGGDFITTMTMDAKDNLYVGTGSEGIVYKITPAGKSSVLYDAKENSITALTLDKSGNLYAGTGPKGLLYRITPEGIATVVYDRATSFYTGLRLADDGTLYATTVNAAYHIYPSAAEPTRPVVQPLDNPRDVDFLTLALLPSGGVVMGTGNIGELYTSQPENTEGAGTVDRPAAAGTFESVIHDNKLVSQWGTLRWNAMLPSSARLRVETRTGNVAEPDATWSEWKSLAAVSGSEGRVASPPARFIQYRLMLSGNPGAANGGAEADHSPSVREVSLSYMPRNQAPRVAFLMPQGGERWAKTQTVRWAGIDPDNDTLSYELMYSTDGVTWKPLPSGTAGGASTPNAAANPAPTPAVTLEGAQKRLDAQKDTPEPIKRLVLESMQRRQAAGGTDEFPSASALRQTSKAWDTKSLPDGTYWLKIVASDIASNPSDPQTAQAISEPFVICNSLPALTMGGTPVVGADKRVLLTGSASQTLITLTAVQYRIDGGDWLAAAPKDGLFDSANEGFTLITPPLTSGKHTIEVAAFNAANGKTSQKIEVTVP